MQTIRRESPYPSLYKQLSIDCARCCGLCCAALCLLKSADFPENKPAGTPCRHLSENFRCTRHNRLAHEGRRGCIAYDCFGAGQFVAQNLYPGRDWRSHPEVAQAMYGEFHMAVQMFQMLWHLAEAAHLTPCKPLYGDIDTLVQDILANMHRADLYAASSIEQYRTRVNPVLKKAGELVAAHFGQAFHGRGGNYLGHNLQKADLRGRDLSMALLIAANLRKCDLSGVNFLGADLRDADIRGADMRNSVFLTQGQVNAAKGSAHTLLPPALSAPPAWLPPT